MKVPSRRWLNRALTHENGRDVVQFEVIETAAGETFRLTFESSTSAWRQGVWLATEGELSVSNIIAAQVVLWSDSAPGTVDVLVRVTDGLLRFYNVWDSGRGLGPHESLSATSGMLVEEDAAGVRRYRCNDIGLNPTFEKLVFTLQRTSS